MPEKCTYFKSKRLINGGAIVTFVGGWGYFQKKTHTSPPRLVGTREYNPWIQDFLFGLASGEFRRVIDH